MSARLFTLRTLSAALLGAGAASVHAAGFQLLEQNASGLGNAYAGSAAVAENASTIYFNPAGMAYLPGANVSAGVNAIWPSFKFKNDGSTNPNFMGPGPATGGNGSDAGHLGIVPNAYLSWQLTDRWFAGVGLGAPFGLMTQYDSDWVGRYHSKKFDIKTININPSVAYKVNDQFAIGAGLNWQRVEAEYTRQTVIGPGRSTGADVNMDGDAWGWNIGFMLQATEATRLGLSYRSKIRHTAKGDTELDIGRSFDAQASVDLPDTLIFSTVHQLNERWQLLGDISWTGWSSLQSLTIENSGAGAANDALTLNFRDTWRVALGANYQFAPQWKWKVGVAYDQSPVHDAEYRPTSLPDTDRWWFSTGVQYQATKSTTIDVGYTYLYLRDTDIDNTGDNLNTKGLVKGSYSSKGNIVGIQVSSRF